MALRTNGVYDKMAFPAYEFREYPKWVTRPNGKQVIVQSLAEELKVASEPGEAAETDRPEAVEKQDLLAIINKQNEELRAFRAAAEEKNEDEEVAQIGDTPKPGTIASKVTAPPGTKK